MALAIWKYPLTIADEQSLQMPAGAEILAVQMQGDTPCLWAKVDPSAAKMGRRIIIHGTGHAASPCAGRYIGTFQMYGGGLVSHVFEHADDGQ